MTGPPTLRTERLTLRPFTLADAPAVEKYCGAYEVAYNTLLIPHPYPEGAAAEWIGRQAEDFALGRTANFVIDAGELVGTVGLKLQEHGLAEIGYWIGIPFWGRGYASEAAREVVRYGLEERRLHRIYAWHFTRNPASGRVLQKCGMQYEGTLRQHQKKWDEYVDLACYGVLRSEWRQAPTTNGRKNSNPRIAAIQRSRR